ncbi:MAG: hypothetical protein ABI857_11680 [Acidobacteriota bacterium]
MKATVRNCLSPIAAVVTLVIGIGFVAAIRAVASVFSTPVSVTPVLRVETTNRFDPFSAPKLKASRTEFSCYDLSILPIWHELKNDNAFKERLQFSDGVANCSEMLETKKADLNRDNTDEFLVRGKGPVLCGGIGNCNYWVFEVKNGAVRKLLAGVHEADAHEFGVDEVQKSRTRGYSDILLTDRNGQNDLRFQTYRFDGTAYIESRCMSEVPRLLRDGAGSWELITCEEYYRRRDEMREAISHM